MVAAKKKAVVKKKPVKNDLAVFDDQLAELAKLYQESEKDTIGGTNKISLEGGVFSYQGEVIKSESLNAVILSSAFEHAYYEGDYDPDNMSGPTCYAIRLATTATSESIAPSPNCQEAMSEACNKCEYNKFGTARDGTGKGKACRQRRRIALVLEDDLEDIGRAEVAYMTIPVTSSKEWALYVKELSTIYKRPPFAVVTEIKLVRDTKTQFKLEFSFIDSIKSKASLTHILENRETYDSEILYEFPAPEDKKKEEVRKPAAKKTAAKKTAAKKTAVKKTARTRRR